MPTPTAKPMPSPMHKLGIPLRPVAPQQPECPPPKRGDAKVMPGKTKYYGPAYR